MKAGYALFLSAVAVLFTLTLTAPYFEKVGDEGSARFNYEVFSGFCHQRPERSFHLFGYKMAVCARCFGVYFGLLAGCLLYPAVWAKRGGIPPGWLLAASLLPLALDGRVEFLGLWAGSNLLRFMTGLLFGGFVPFYLIPALDKAAGVFIRRLR